ncbi:MAG: acyl-CoA dehydrogenase [Jatrophihabitans sp.]|uniref:acyl-CoA dehydrogenase n=1 Tax=Jatrophihabitans sp. TaxID=1932789 RepID=UPI003F7DA7B2
MNDATGAFDGAPLPSWADEVRGSAAASAGKVADAIALADTVGRLLPVPGAGATALRWSVLALVAEQDLTVARVLEPHVDALAILDEAGLPRPQGVWGVFAAEAAGVRLDATDDGARTTLTGTKPWCSLADRLDGALVTAFTGDRRRLYQVDLRQPGVEPLPSDGWVARGLSAVTSVGVVFDGAVATPVGAPSWYLDRDGFAWGGIGVAACWFGAARALLTQLRAAARDDDVSRMHVGAVDVALHGAAATLQVAAALVDSGRAGGAEGSRLATRVRSVVAGAVEQTLHHTTHALGPGPLAFDDQYARRVADLELYVRQHHGERDLALLGAELTAR